MTLWSFFWRHIGVSTGRLALPIAVRRGPAYEVL